MNTTQKKHESILLVEDCPDILEILVDSVSDHFDKVYTASNGQDALTIAKEKNVYFIITDINMPQMSGTDFVTNLRALGNHAPILFLTGEGKKDVFLSAVRLGICDVIEKPFKVPELLKSIERAIEIEKRKEAISRLEATQPEDPSVAKEKKMLGLLQAVSNKKTG